MQITKKPNMMPDITPPQAEQNQEKEGKVEKAAVGGENKSAKVQPVSSTSSGMDKKGGQNLQAGLLANKLNKKVK